MPLTDHIALVSLTRDITMRDLLQAGAAVQKQLTRDFTPIWGLRATLDTFADLSSIPSDYHPIVLFSDPEDLIGQLDVAIGPELAADLIDDFERDRLAGLHLNAFTRQPFALVEATDAWSVVLSHEVLEIIADPYGNRLIAAAHPLDPSERVKYLLEVCDPCQSIWYPVNGVPVSDFYTPRYFDPVGLDGGRYSFSGQITRPLEILDGGYLSWIDPDDSGLYQLEGGATEPVRVASLLELARSTAPLRTIVDTNPNSPQISWQALRPAGTAVAAGAAYDAVSQASQGAALRTAEAVFSLATGAG
ncbi:MAG TPA: hypothetical protein VFX51_15515 [Solirubrobacteraceae bacterium]|nr:hypothetical protein [Solirubrobacteraceae bacterium]